MSIVSRAAAALTDMLAGTSARTGARIALDPLAICDRSDVLALAEPGLVSPNRACRLIACRDGWIAANLPRDEDLELVPAWLGETIDGDPWDALTAAAATALAAPFAAAGAELGLAVARLGETGADASIPPAHRWGAPTAARPRHLHVLDLSTLWAGPLCASVFAAMGHDVHKIESATRPDPVASATPALDRRLNGAKRRSAIAFDDPPAIAALRDEMAVADILVTSARPRAFDALGLSPAAAFAANPGLTWIAITGHGWSGDAGMRVAFGDDAAVAGGLVEWSDGAPRFAGDAVADPLTGIAAAIAGIEAIGNGGGVLIDAALARVSAGVVAQFG